MAVVDQHLDDDDHDDMMVMMVIMTMIMRVTMVLMMKMMMFTFVDNKTSSNMGTGLPLIFSSLTDDGDDDDIHFC